tara:strand:+ start:19 stop:438 length:420 start_codon:yes stop_codon:yes gene_type:complete
MDKLFIDTNIVLDLLSKRPEFYHEAQELFTLAERQKIKLFVSSLTIANTYYLLSRQYNSGDAKIILTKFEILADILPFDGKVVRLALLSEDFKDFEDAIQYYIALENNIPIIITRNKKDFKNSLLPIFTAREYLNNSGL